MLKTNPLAGGKKSKIIILIVFVAIIASLIIFFYHKWYSYEALTKSQLDDAKKNFESEKVTNITMGVVLQIDRENKKLTIIDELGKGTQMIYVTDNTAILMSGKGKEENIKTDFDSIKENMFIRTITNQVTKNQVRVEASDLFIINVNRVESEIKL